MSEASAGGCGWDGRRQFSYLVRFCWDRRLVTSAANGNPHVQGLLQPQAQSIRNYSRSFVSVSHREAQRSSGRSLLWRSAAQGVRRSDRRSGHRENSSTPLPAAVAEAEQGCRIRLHLQRTSLPDRIPAVHRQRSRTPGHQQEQGRTFAADCALRHCAEREETDDGSGGRRSASSFGGDSRRNSPLVQSRDGRREAVTDSSGRTARTGRPTRLPCPAPAEAESRAALPAYAAGLGGDEGVYPAPTLPCGKSLPSGAVSARDHCRGISALSRTAETNQHHLRKRADRRLRSANAEYQPRHHRRYRDRLPSWRSSTTGRPEESI